MSRIIELYISEELEYAGIPEYQELERMLAELKAELGDAAMKRISLSF